LQKDTYNTVLVSEQKKAQLQKKAVCGPDPHNFGNTDPHPDLHPHKKIRIWIRIKICKLDLDPVADPHQSADVEPKCI
jgi:hypothetical protein